jgi:hypothetical protein
MQVDDRNIAHMENQVKAGGRSQWKKLYIYGTGLDRRHRDLA